MSASEIAVTGTRAMYDATNRSAIDRVASDGAAALGHSHHDVFGAVNGDAGQSIKARDSACPIARTGSAVASNSHNAAIGVNPADGVIAGVGDVDPA